MASPLVSPVTFGALSQCVSADSPVGPSPLQGQSPPSNPAHPLVSTQRLHRDTESRMSLLSGSWSGTPSLYAVYGRPGLGSILAMTGAVSGVMLQPLACVFSFNLYSCPRLWA